MLLAVLNQHIRVNGEDYAYTASSSHSISNAYVAPHAQSSKPLDLECTSPVTACTFICLTLRYAPPASVQHDKYFHDPVIHR
jgi:hypothetical protein